MTVGPITFSLHWMLLGVSLVVLGLQCVYMGILSQVFFDYSGAVTAQLVPALPYTRACRRERGAVRGRPGAWRGLLTLNYVRNGFSLLAGSTATTWA